MKATILICDVQLLEDTQEVLQECKRTRLTQHGFRSAIEGSRGLLAGMPKNFLHGLAVITGMLKFKDEVLFA